MKVRPFFGFIAIILVSLITLCSCVYTPASSSLSGCVVLEDGASPNRILVTVTAKDGSGSYNVRTDSDGRFTIGDITPSVYTVSFSKAGYYSESLEDVIVGDGKVVTLETVTLMMKLGTFTGKVIDDTGNPISGASVTVSGRGYSFSATTDANGNYTITAKPGIYTDITVSAINPCRYLQGTLNKTVSADTETKLGNSTLLPDTHNYVLTSVVEATTSAKGYREYRCTNCNHVETVDIPKRTDGARWAGIRASSYGLEESFGSYPGINSMASYAEKMESCYAGSNGTVILIVGVVSEDLKSCFLDFPISEEIANVTCSNVDFYEDYLTALDKGGYSVWLQVEPGNADLVKLAKAVMNHYKHHSCVKGFGIDVEWYKRADNRNGMKLSSDGDEPNTVSKVLTAVKAINSSYTVFVKHWDEKWLPDPKEGLVFVNDSQGFFEGGWGKGSERKPSLEKMVNECARWAEDYDPCPVMFQIGYDADEGIWGEMENPAEELGKAIIAGCTTSNDIGIIWVDFTLKEVIEKID